MMLKLEFGVLLLYTFGLSLVICRTFNCIKNKSTLPVCLPEEYVKETSPSVYNKDEKEILLFPSEINVEDIDITGSITYSLFFQVKWRDSRILIKEDLINTTTWMPLDSEIKKHIWVPDFYIYRAQKIYKPSVLETESLRVNGMGYFRSSMELIAKTKCRMDLSKFPHDQQSCIFEVGSYSYSDEWFLPKLEEHDYSKIIPQPNGYSLTTKKMKKTQTWPTGNYTTVGLEVLIKRHVTFYVLNYYIPTGLMVIISFASFAIPASHEGLLGRIAFLVTLVLVVMGIFNTAKSNLPASDVPNYIEIWIIVCILFILGAFSQTILVFSLITSNVFQTRYKRSQIMITPIDEANKMEDERIKAKSINSIENSHSDEEQEKMLKKIDNISFLIFMLCFFLFNISFWLITTY